jgi:hypothetical protein
VRSDPKVNLCVEVSRLQPSGARGTATQWLVNAWTSGGNVPDATIRLQSTPATATAMFSFGCGTWDNTASCDLGAMDANSQARQLEATLTVPANQTAVQTATLTVIGSAAYLPQDPVASATVSLTAPTSPAPATSASPLAVGSLPDIPTPSTTLSPGGNAAGLFPTLQPSASGGSGGNSANVNKVANTSALPESAPVVGAQLAGLAALGLAFVLAVTRLSIRRRPGHGSAASAASSTSSTAAGDESAKTDQPAQAGTASPAPEDGQQSGQGEPPETGDKTP